MFPSGLRSRRGGEGRRSPALGPRDDMPLSVRMVLFSNARREGDDAGVAPTLRCIESRKRTTCRPIGEKRAVASFHGANRDPGGPLCSPEVPIWCEKRALSVQSLDETRKISLAGGRKQSSANQSRRGVSLLTGKNTGNLFGFELFSARGQAGCARQLGTSGVNSLRQQAGKVGTHNRQRMLRICQAGLAA